MEEDSNRQEGYIGAFTVFVRQDVFEPGSHQTQRVTMGTYIIVMEGLKLFGGQQ